MAKAVKAEKWIHNPDRDFMRDGADLFKVGARCDAWRAFLNSKTVAALKKIKGHVIWFNQHEYFDKLICEFDCSERRLTAVIEGLMRPGHQMPVKFSRVDIYDARAWCYLPLSCFAHTRGFKERSGVKHWGSEVLELNEMPMVEFGIKLPWVVSRDCFTMTHKVKGDVRFAEMGFAHPQLDAHFKNCRWVADGTFTRDATRKEMEDALFAKVQAKCRNYQVTIK
jgi:hypothetical protein